MTPAACAGGARPAAGRPRTRRALLRVCNVPGVPPATNLATGDLLISGLARPALSRDGEPAGPVP